MSKVRSYLLLFLITVGHGNIAQTQQSNQPNILWIIADDLSPDLGCYGNQVVHTPHVDQLANEGMRFTHAFATNPICSPSRSALYTGMYQTTIGAHQHRTFQTAPLPDSIQAIPQLFEAAGYFTSNGYGTPESRPGKTDFNFKADSIFEGTDWSQRKPGQPFFASVQIHFPHRTFEQDTLYPVDPGEVALPPYYPDHPISRKDWSDYLESVQQMDRELGKILNRLETEGLVENTVVFFFSDHGRPHLRAKQWLYDAGIQVPLIVRWPGKIDLGTSDQLVSLVDISAASMKLAQIDIPDYLHGLDFLDKDKSRSYIFATRNRADAVVDHIRAVRDKQYKYIRNFMPEKPYTQFGHYKLYNYPILTLMHYLNSKDSLNEAQKLFMQPQKPQEELYDIQVDPWEIHNLAYDPVYKELRQQMSEVLDEWMQQTRDQGAKDPDDYEVLLEQRWEKYGARWKIRGIEDPRDIDFEAYLKWWKNEMELQ